MNIERLAARLRRTKNKSRADGVAGEKKIKIGLYAVRRKAMI